MWFRLLWHNVTVAWSVCLSVCLSRSCIVLKWQKISSRFFAYDSPLSLSDRVKFAYRSSPNFAPKWPIPCWLERLRHLMVELRPKNRRMVRDSAMVTMESQEPIGNHSLFWMLPSLTPYDLPFFSNWGSYAYKRRHLLPDYFGPWSYFLLNKQHRVFCEISDDIRRNLQQIKQFKVFQGHRSWCQSIVHMQLIYLSIIAIFETLQHKARIWLVFATLPCLTHLLKGNRQNFWMKLTLQKLEGFVYHAVKIALS